MLSTATIKVPNEYAAFPATPEDKQVAEIMHALVCKSMEANRAGFQELVKGHLLGKTTAMLIEVA